MMRMIAILMALHVLITASHADPGPWRSEILVECEHGLGGTAVGDLDPDTPGNEVVTVSSAGEVWLVRRGDTGWRPERIHAGEGELIMCAIGDVDPRYPGNEFVGVGMVQGEESLSEPGQVLLIHRERGAWQAQPIFTDDHMLHGVAIGDVSSRHAGNEIVVCGFNHRARLLYFEDQRWVSDTIYVANDRLKIALIADVLPERDGLEVVVCGSDGKVVVLCEGKLGWQHEVIFSDRIGQSRLAAGEPGVLIGGDGGKVTLARRQDRAWSTEFLTRDTGKIRGVAMAELDEWIPGPELYACGYSKHVMQLARDQGGFWYAKIIFTAERPLHHLVAGEFDPQHPGPELVTCGHEGRLFALYPGR